MLKVMPFYQVTSTNKFTHFCSIFIRVRNTRWFDLFILFDMNQHVQTFKANYTKIYLLCAYAHSKKVSSY